VEVLELKNFSHVAVIAATALGFVAELAGAEAGADAGAEAEAEPDPALAADVLALLLQAATVAASARPSVRLSAGVISRRARESDRMTRLLFSKDVSLKAVSSRGYLRACSQSLHRLFPAPRTVAGRWPTPTSG
jgi:hypothetical protein